ncbi:MAG: BrnT family toxin [Cellvibrionaceae bacterium]|nr:BrnT family toxin [Cellvibrionaceae bacterium]
MIAWDERKNAINKKKHGLSFESAALVFEPGKRSWITKVHVSS